MQGDSSRDLQPSAAQLSAPAAARKPAPGELFRQHCVKCHRADGTGKGTRGRLPEIPDFTDVSWQAKRTDAQLAASILDGKGTEMPRWRGKISEEEARGLVAHLRAFAPTMRKSPQEGRERFAGFDERYRRLQKQFDELLRQFRERSKNPPGATPSKPSGSRQPEVPKPSAPAAVGTPAVRELFRQHCVKCHGTDGTGSPARGRLPEIPDFTAASWQARRSEAQLLVSILDGKGSEMPRWRGKIREEEARGLVAHVRAFAPTTEKSPQEKQEGLAPTFWWPEQEEPEGLAGAEPTEAEAPRNFSKKLVRWLGKFHPPAVHFPIALLTAAAVAELLRMATGKSVFNTVSRYCVWFGALTALVAGVLGWFRGGFGLTDASWVLMTHRWLGTSTVACAVLILVLSEASRHLERRRTQMWFRAMLLIVAALALVTGFFGGAVVFGLDHYTWPV